MKETGYEGTSYEDNLFKGELENLEKEITDDFDISTDEQITDPFANEGN